MAEYNYVRLGQANLSGDMEALFKDEFIPLLLTRFDEKRVLKGHVRNKTIKSGKSASFPVFGKVGAKYMGIGEGCLGNQKIEKNEVTIFIDPFLVSDVILHSLEEKMSETDDREIIAEEMARALANTEDRQLLQVGVLAARANSPLTDGDQYKNSGSVLVFPREIQWDGGMLANAVYQAGVELDQKDIPEANRRAYFRPMQYALIAQYEDVKNHQVGTGSYSAGTTGTINGIQLIKTNHLPDSNIAKGTSGTQPNNIYYGDFSKTLGLVMTGEAIGTVSLIGLTTEVSWNPEYFHHLLTARISQGHGILRPECAVEIAFDPDRSVNDNDNDDEGGDEEQGGGENPPQEG